MFPEPRRRRRRSKLMLPLLVAALVAVALVVGSLGSGTLASRDFYDLVTEATLDLRSDADSFVELATGPLLMGRDEYVGAIEQVEKSLADSLATIPAADDLPPEVRGTRRLTVATLERWQEGIAAFKGATLNIVDLPTAGLGDAELASAVASLRVADELYLVLRSELEALRVELDIPEMALPQLRFVPVDAVTSGYITGLSERLKSSELLAGLRALEIINLITDPAPLGGNEDFDAARLPFTDLVTVQVVVFNGGNLPEANLTVSLTLQNSASGEVIQRSEAIGLLEANAQGAVSFVDLPVEAGQRYLILARAVTEVVDLGAPGAETLEIFISQDAQIPDQSTTTAP